MPNAGGGSSEALLPRDRPVLIYDGECGFCRRWIERSRESTGDGVEFLPFQAPEIGERFPSLPPEDLGRAVHFVEADGSVWAGAHAVFRLLARAGRHGRCLWLYQHVSAFAGVSERCYRFVAEHRELFSRFTTSGREY